MKRFIWIMLAFMVISAGGGDEKLTPLQYIEIYKRIAVIEMHRTGIPASITMAQGLLESGNGNSRLAREGNNHFGIKCKKTWNGKTIIEDDDAPQECFRAYDSAYLSYLDHSEFLVNGQRYAFLFEYGRTDYKNWAHGLKQAGYATNPKYPELLITIIERHELYKLDHMSLAELGIEPKPNELPADPLPVKVEDKVVALNNIPVTTVLPGDNVVDIAKRNSMGSWQIRRYNDLPKDHVLKPGENLYLKPKRRSGLVTYHVVEPGETMWDISQEHGIKLKQLYWKNRLDRKAGEQPAPGEVLYLQERNPNEVIRKGNEKPTEIKPTEESVPIQPFIIEDKPDSSYKIEVKIIEVIPPSNTDTSIVREHEDVSNQIHLHEVQVGETLFSISKKYQVSVEQIRELNGLKDFGIQVGQKLIVNGEASVENPDTETTTFTHTVKTGETLYSISKKYNISVTDLKTFNQLMSDQVSIGQKLILNPGNGQRIEKSTNELPLTHTVQKGDTLYNLSRKYQVSIAELKRLNKLETDDLSLGMELKLR